jgi:hypothetical protein
MQLWVLYFADISLSQVFVLIWETITYLGNYCHHVSPTVPLAVPHLYSAQVLKCNISPHGRVSGIYCGSHRFSAHVANVCDFNTWRRKWQLGILPHSTGGDRNVGINTCVQRLSSYNPSILHTYTPALSHRHMILSWLAWTRLRVM